jgi:hypothetical protein
MPASRIVLDVELEFAASLEDRRGRAHFDGQAVLERKSDVLRLRRKNTQRTCAVASLRLK